MAAVAGASAQELEGDNHSIFFYGVLLHAAVIRRVIGHPGQQLYYQPAILFVRHSLRMMMHSY
jgi:hypothetical protein